MISLFLFVSFVLVIFLKNYNFFHLFKKNKAKYFIFSVEMQVVHLEKWKLLVKKNFLGNW